jgi:hypothetical protein
MTTTHELPYASTKCFRRTLAGSSEVHKRQAVEIDGLASALASGAEPVALLTVIRENADGRTIADDVRDGHPQFVAYTSGDAADVEAGCGLDEPATDRTSHGWRYGGDGEDHE